VIVDMTRSGVTLGAAVEDMDIHSPENGSGVPIQIHSGGLGLLASVIRSLRRKVCQIFHGEDVLRRRTSCLLPVPLAYSRIHALARGRIDET